MCTVIAIMETEQVPAVVGKKPEPPGGLCQPVDVEQQIEHPVEETVTHRILTQVHHPARVQPTRYCVVILSAAKNPGLKIGIPRFTRNDSLRLHVFLLNSPGNFGTQGPGDIHRRFEPVLVKTIPRPGPAVPCAALALNLGQPTPGFQRRGPVLGMVIIHFVDDSTGTRRALRIERHNVIDRRFDALQTVHPVSDRNRVIVQRIFATDVIP